MRHKVFGRKLNRDIKERKALFRSLAKAVIEKGRIKTTLPKAKAVIGEIEKLVTKAKKGTNASIKGLYAFIPKKHIVKKLTDEIAPKFANRNGGYLRIQRVGRRLSDSAEEVIMEWTYEVEEHAKKGEKKNEKGKEAEVKKNDKKKEEKKEKVDKKKEKKKSKK